MPLAISPKNSTPSLDSFRAWAEAHQTELRSVLSTDGAILLRNFPVDRAEDFAAVVESVIGSKPINYIGEGSRNKVAEGVYTSTSAPAQFKIPLHNEYTCTNTPLHYICFYCDIAPEAGSGQTILGLTETISQEILSKRPDIWNFFYGKKLRYISRHPPEGSFFAKVNVTHRTWQQAFETNNKEDIDRICKEKGLEYKWNGDWIEVWRIVPAIRGPDEHFDHPYFFNQAYLYHANPRIRGGWMNHILANLLYIMKSTNQYDIELEDGTPLPRDIVYGIYDILDQNTIQFDWQKRDVLIIDNFKGLHGRAPTKGQRRILTCMIP